MDWNKAWEAIQQYVPARWAQILAAFIAVGTVVAALSHWGELLKWIRGPFWRWSKRLMASLLRKAWLRWGWQLVQETDRLVGIAIMSARLGPTRVYLDVDVTNVDLDATLTFMNVTVTVEVKWRGKWIEIGTVRAPYPESFRAPTLSDKEHPYFIDIEQHQAGAFLCAAQMRHRVYVTAKTVVTLLADGGARRAPERDFAWFGVFREGLDVQ